MKYIVFISLFVITITTYGQSELIRTMGGFGFSSLDDSRLRFGFFSGIQYVNINKNNFQFCTGLEYGGKGKISYSSSYNYYYDLQSSKAIIKHHFLSVPLTIGYYGEDLIFASIEGGLLPRFLVQAKELREWSDESYIPQKITNENVTKEYNRLFLSGLLQLTIGYTIDAKQSISLNSRFSFGIAQFDLKNQFNTGITEYWDKSGVFMLSYNYTFKQKKIN